ncbi:MAG: DUF1996 domain-containing protein [Proteobacteria bacterium]|nr:MAG: DUF1996 domain-containing protein [Pseudomonadota bacterium]
MRKSLRLISSGVLMCFSAVLYVNCSGFIPGQTGSADSSSSGSSTLSAWGDGWTGPDSPPQNGTYKSIPSNFNVAEHIWGTLGQPAPPESTGCGVGRDGAGAPDVVGAFRFLCTASHNRYDDPIVFPGKKGASHLHTFFGNTEADANSTFESLRKSGESTCDGGPLNRSAYWMPSMMDGRGHVVMPDYVTVYYKRRPKNDPNCKIQGKECVDLPRGLRMVFGYNMGRGYDHAEQAHVHWACDDGTIGAGGKNEHATIGDAMCPVGSHVGAGFSSPDCWDGKNLDSKDHRSHLANGSYGSWGYYKCPDTHPYVIPAFTMKAWFASHGDWFGAWDDDVMKEWHDNAIDKLQNCSAGDMGSGRGLIRPAGFKWAADPQIVDPPMVTPAMKLLQEKSMIEMHNVYKDEPGEHAHAHSSMGH